MIIASPPPKRCETHLFLRCLKGATGSIGVAAGRTLTSLTSCAQESSLKENTTSRKPSSSFGSVAALKVGQLTVSFEEGFRRGVGQIVGLKRWNTCGLRLRGLGWLRVRPDSKQ